MHEVKTTRSLSRPIEADDAARVEVAGRQSDFSGAGFGEREMGWDVGSRVKAVKLAHRLKVSFPTDRILLDEAEIL